MIQYKCDLCGEVTNKNDIHIFQEFPRYIDQYEICTCNKNYLSLPGLGSAETHLCLNCCDKIAKMFFTEYSPSFLIREVNEKLDKLEAKVYER